MTKWHVSWQELFAVEYREVVICNGKHKHRADVCLPQPDNSLLIVEFQHSRISTDKIREREQFYRLLCSFGDLRWAEKLRWQY